MSKTNKVLTVILVASLLFTSLAFLPREPLPSGDANMAGAGFLILGVPVSIITAIALGVSLLLEKVGRHNPSRLKIWRNIILVLFILALCYVAMSIYRLSTAKLEVL